METLMRWTSQPHSQVGIAIPLNWKVKWPVQSQISHLAYWCIWPRIRIRTAMTLHKSGSKCFSDIVFCKKTGQKFHFLGNLISHFVSFGTKTFCFDAYWKDLFHFIFLTPPFILSLSHFFPLDKGARGERKQRNETNIWLETLTFFVDQLFTAPTSHL